MSVCLSNLPIEHGWTQRIEDGKALPKHKVLFEMKWLCRFRLIHFKMNTISGGPQPKKFFYLSWNSLWEQRVDHHLSGDVLKNYGDQLADIYAFMHLYLKVRSLYFILNWTTSQCSDFNNGCWSVENGSRPWPSNSENTAASLFRALGCFRGFKYSSLACSTKVTLQW